MFLVVLVWMLFTAGYRLLDSLVFILVLFVGFCLLGFVLFWLRLVTGGSLVGYVGLNVWLFVICCLFGLCVCFALGGLCVQCGFCFDFADFCCLVLFYFSVWLFFFLFDFKLNCFSFVYTFVLVFALFGVFGVCLCFLFVFVVLG